MLCFCVEFIVNFKKPAIQSINTHISADGLEAIWIARDHVDCARHGVGELDTKTCAAILIPVGGFRELRLGLRMELPSHAS